MALITDFWITDLACFISTVFIFIYFYIWHSFGHWQRREIKFIKPSFPFGSVSRSNLGLQTPFADMITEFYNASNDPYVGFFIMSRPLLLIRDVELIRRITTTDFNCFRNHGIYFDEENDPLSGNLFAIEDQKWKLLRAKMSPVFTPRKMKEIFQTFVDCGNKLDNNLRQLAEHSDEFEVCELSACNATNFIASVAFGLDIDCIANPNEIFRHFGRKIFEPTLANSLRIALTLLNPKLMKVLRLGICSHEIEDFFMEIVRKNIECREQSNTIRHDFFQLLIQLKNGIDVSEDDRWTDSRNVEAKQQLTLNEITAQAFGFFAAGFETSSTAMAWCLYEIAKNEKIQTRVQQEIDEVLKQHDGQLTYESLGEMKYLSMCVTGKFEFIQSTNKILKSCLFAESLRLYPPGPTMNRNANDDYMLPNGVVIERGTQLILPVMAVQRDPKFYKNPLEFDPERFSDESRADPEFSKRPYFPFGNGPRICIAMRLSELQIKHSLAIMLQKYCFTQTDEMKNRKISFKSQSFVAIPADGISLKIRKRE